MSNSATSTVYARVPMELKARVIEFAESRGMTMAAACSFLMQAGLGDVPELLSVQSAVVPTYFEFDDSCDIGCIRPVAGRRCGWSISVSGQPLAEIVARAAEHVQAEHPQGPAAVVAHIEAARAARLRGDHS